MSKKITYYVQRYRPSYEAISKEVLVLSENFSKNNEVKIHDLHLDGLTNIKFKKNISSFHFLYYPLLLPYTIHLSKKSDINHIYTSLGDLPYLNVIDLKKTVLTAAASCNINKIKKRVSSLKKLKKIIVESKKQMNDLISLGIDKNLISLIYPPVNLEEFNFSPAENVFNILYASCPTRKEDFEKRGINLICETSKKFEGFNFTLAWRGGAYDEINELVCNNEIKLRFNIKNKIIKDMDNVYSKSHCTIIPYTKFDDYLKLVPNSAIESLAAGKPVLVSSKTEMAEIIEENKCGVVFEPNIGSLHKSIIQLQENYDEYQKNCRKTAEIFSEKIFVKKYEEIYSQT